MYLVPRGIALAVVVVLGYQRPIPIAHVGSGHAELRQQGRLTVLEIRNPDRPMQRVALTHPSDYRQGTNAPYEARLVAESPGRFLVFTDTFESNPGNVQAMCGASDTGERFVHVVALGRLSHETLSVLVESCLLSIDPPPTSPEWRPKRDSAGDVGSLVLHFGDEAQPDLTYYVEADGAVSRPRTEANP